MMQEGKILPATQLDYSSCQEERNRKEGYNTNGSVQVRLEVGSSVASRRGGQLAFGAVEAEARQRRRTDKKIIRNMTLSWAGVFTTQMCWRWVVRGSLLVEMSDSE
jgi:hypothetical protein